MEILKYKSEIRFENLNKNKFLNNFNNKNESYHNYKVDECYFN